MDITLNTGGPADPQYVLEVAAASAEAVRVLNHLTLHHEALGEPYDADRLLRHLATTVMRLPQLLEQVSRWLHEEYAEGRIRMTGGEVLQPVLAVMAVEARLGKAAEDAEVLQVALASAVSVTSHMASREDGSDE